jgi:exocyst complex component 4
LIADKKFIAAALILTRAIRTINKDEMMEVGALADLRTYLIGQQNVSIAENHWVGSHC